MSSLWQIEGDHIDVGYSNLRHARGRPELELRRTLDDMWERYEPYADPDFAQAFARDPDARFWEMYLGCRLLAAGKTLVAASGRKHDGGQPDLCVLDEGRRIWIEAIAPDAGQPGPDQVQGPLPINEGGGLGPMPVRQAQLRATGALLTKRRVLERYLSRGVIAPHESRLIAIGVGRFGSLVPEVPLPLIMSALFPIGPAYMTIDRDSGEVLEEGFHHAPEIAREKAAVARTAFIDPAYSKVSGVIWSRMGIGFAGQPDRPLTLVHNPLAEQPMLQRWGVWDREFVTSRKEDGWESVDVLAAG